MIANELDIKILHIKTIRLIVVLFVLATSHGFSIYAQDTRPKIIDYLDKEIFIETSFAGQSIKLVYEKGNYYMIRSFFGSGRPVLYTLKYKTTFNSDYQITFSEIIEGFSGVDDELDILTSEISTLDRFKLEVEMKNLNLYLNELKIVIHQPDQ